MPWKNTEHTYGLVHRSFHWLMALLVLTMLSVGFYMEGVAPGPGRAELYALHKSIGPIVLLLALLRLIWRQLNPVPGLPADMPLLLRLAAHGNHYLLYGLMIGMPLAGWGMTSAGGRVVSVFGLFELPPLVAPDKELATLFHDLHEAGAVALIVFIGLHVAGALYHHVIRKDAVLLRMLRGVPVTDAR